MKNENATKKWIKDHIWIYSHFSACFRRRQSSEPTPPFATTHSARIQYYTTVFPWLLPYSLLHNCTHSHILLRCPHFMYVNPYSSSSSPHIRCRRHIYAFLSRNGGYEGRERKSKVRPRNEIYRWKPVSFGRAIVQYRASSFQTSWSRIACCCVIASPPVNVDCKSPSQKKVSPTLLSSFSQGIGGREGGKKEG